MHLDLLIKLMGLYAIIQHQIMITNSIQETHKAYFIKIIHFMIIINPRNPIIILVTKLIQIFNRL